MNLRVTNSALLVLLSLLTLTGAYGIVWPLPAWLFEAHRLAGFTLLALIPWKAGIAWRSLRRGLGWRPDRNVGLGVSLVLAAAAVSVLALGILWAANLWPEWRLLGDTAISWHWMAALGLVPFLAVHLWRRWPKPRLPELASRRAVMRYLGWGALGVAGWGVMNWVARQREAPGSVRAATGSRERASYTGLAMPVTQSYGEGKIVVEAPRWTLSLTGVVAQPLTLTYPEFLALPSSRLQATLDCTTGWYSTQVWRGVSLGDLLRSAVIPPSASSVRLSGVSGYTAEFPLAEAEDILLATHVGDQALDHWHGFPVRAVAPSRRGWHWVKWLTAVEVRAGPTA